MATQNSSSPGGEAHAVAMESTSTAEEQAAKAVHKRYEGLVMVRTKAIKGKGAWYWAHLEPILVHSSDSGFPKAVKLRCSLCEAVFSASNPSRTASEHLKRGTCPNFNMSAKPISSVPGEPSSTVTLSPAVAPPESPPPPPSSQQQHHHNHRKRSGSGGGDRSGGVLSPTDTSSSYQVSPLAIVDPSRFAVDLAYSPPPPPLMSTAIVATVTSGTGMYASQQHHQQQQQHLVLSGGKEDLGALAMLKDTVKRLKSPRDSDGPSLSKTQIDSAIDYLAEWVYECCGTVSISCLEHPKFKSFLNQVGLPPISRREFVGSRLDTKFEEAKAESEAKIRDSMFFQIASHGWKSKSKSIMSEENLVNLAVNLPNGTSVFRRAVFTTGLVPSNYAQEVLWDTITEICGNNVQQCAGIVADKFKTKALKNLEDQHHWMVNLSCQHQGFHSLINDFHKDLQIFKNVTENCFKLVTFVNNNPQLRTTFHKYQLQEYGLAGLLRAPFGRSLEGRSDFGPVHNMVEDILNSARALQLVFLDESYKIVSMEEESIARDMEQMMRNPHFWNEVEAVHSLVKAIKSFARDVETDKPRVGQCLPLWEELKVKVKDWCTKFHILEGPIEKVIEKRFRKNYHPAWAAAFILDPFYLVRDSSGKYLPPFKFLTPEQEKDVDRLITRLVSRDEAHIALMELMKWRTEGLDPVYAQAVQEKQRDPSTGKMKITNPQSSRLVWETYLTEFKCLGKVAVRLIFLHATACGFKCNWSLLKWMSANSHSRVGMDRARKLVFIAAHSKLERRDFRNDEDKDAELFALANGEDDVLNDVFVETSTM